LPWLNALAKAGVELGENGSVIPRPEGEAIGAGANRVPIPQDLLDASYLLITSDNSTADGASSLIAKDVATPIAGCVATLRASGWFIPAMNLGWGCRCFYCRKGLHYRVLMHCPCRYQP
jgi:hypothetical protein